MRALAPLSPWDWLTGQRIRRRKDLVRIGSAYGGWTVPGALFHEESICYLAGCGEDITFDLGLVRRFRSQVFGFDPTPRAILHVQKATQGVDGYTFIPVGLWNSDCELQFFAPRKEGNVSHSIVNLHGTSTSITAPVRSLRSLMKELGHDHLTLLKLDIEGAEYTVIDDFLRERIRVDVLCVEYDEFFAPKDSNYRERIRTSVGKLIEAGYSMIHSEGNANYTFLLRS